MRRFVKLFILFWLVFISVMCCIRTAWIHLKPVFVEKNVLDKKIHTIVLGPSNGECAWDDSIISGSKNLCASAMSFGGALNNLKWATEYNENAPDTIILCASLVTLVYIPDEEMIHQLLAWQEEKRNLLNYSNFFKNYCRYFEYWKYIFTSFSFHNFQEYGTIDGGYLYLERDKLDNPHVYDRINSVIERMHERDEQVSEEYLMKYCTYQISSIRKIQEYCDAHQQTLIILSTPLYRIPDMISDKGYWHLICSELGDSTLVADYSRFELPDTTYYGDLEHLNYKGARFFSEHIEKEGIQVRFALDYCKNQETFKNKQEMH